MKGVGLSYDAALIYTIHSMGPYFGSLFTRGAHGSNRRSRVFIWGVQSGAFSV